MGGGTYVCKHFANACTVYLLQIYFVLQTNKIVSNIVDFCHILFHIQFFKINDEHARSL